MIKRVNAEFENTDLAELALKRARESISDVFAAEIMCSKQAKRAERLQGATHYTVMPMAPTAQNYITAVMETPIDLNSVPEPLRRTTARACIVCSENAVRNVSSLLGAMGGLNIHTSE